MSLFAVGNMLLKYKRAKLPRAITANWAFVVLGWAFIVTALVGNIIYDLEVLKYWAMYFSGTVRASFASCLVVCCLIVSPLAHYRFRHDWPCPHPPPPPLLPQGASLHFVRGYVDLGGLIAS